MSNLVLVRHGETDWSITGQHTSITDLDLTARGVLQAKALGRRLAGRTFAAVRCSPRLRARRTAELAGLAVSAYDENLAEWSYGDFEGLTSAEIDQRQPNWSVWTDGCPGGETPAHVRARVDRLLARERDADVALVAHGHILRALAARWIGLDVDGGALLALDPAGVSELGFEHGRRVVRHWNEQAEISPG